MIKTYIITNMLGKSPKFSLETHWAFKFIQRLDTDYQGL